MPSYILSTGLLQTSGNPVIKKEGILSTVGDKNNKDPLTPIEQLIRDFNGGLKIDHKSKNELQLTAQHALTATTTVTKSNEKSSATSLLNDTKQFEELLARTFTPNEINLLKKHYNQGVIANAGMAVCLITDTLEPNKIVIEQPINRSHNLYRMSEKIYLKTIVSVFPVYTYDASGDCIPAGNLPGEVEVLYRLTDKGFLLQSVACDTQILRDILLGVKTLTVEKIIAESKKNYFPVNDTKTIKPLATENFATATTTAAATTTTTASTTEAPATTTNTATAASSSIVSNQWINEILNELERHRDHLKSKIITQTSTASLTPEEQKHNYITHAINLMTRYKEGKIKNETLLNHFANYTSTAEGIPHKSTMNKLLDINSNTTKLLIKINNQLMSKLKSTASPSTTPLSQPISKIPIQIDTKKQLTPAKKAAELGDKGFLYKISAQDLKDSKNKTIESDGINYSRDKRREPIRSLFLDVQRGVRINHQSYQNNKTSKDILNENDFIKFLKKTFSEPHYQQIIKHYSQGPMMFLPYVLLGEYAESKTPITFESAMDEYRYDDLYQDGSHVYLRALTYQVPLKIILPSDPTDVIFIESYISGPFQAKFKLTDDYFQLEEVSTDSPLLYDIFKRINHPITRVFFNVVLTELENNLENNILSEDLKNLLSNAKEHESTLFLPKCDPLLQLNCILQLYFKIEALKGNDKATSENIAIDKAMCLFFILINDISSLKSELAFRDECLKLPSHFLSKSVNIANKDTKSDYGDVKNTTTTTFQIQEALDSVWQHLTTEAIINSNKNALLNYKKENSIYFEYSRLNALYNLAQIIYSLQKQFPERAMNIGFIFINQLNDFKRHNDVVKIYNQTKEQLSVEIDYTFPNDQHYKAFPNALSDSKSHHPTVQISPVDKHPALLTPARIIFNIDLPFIKKMQRELKHPELDSLISEIDQAEIQLSENKSKPEAYNSLIFKLIDTLEYLSSTQIKTVNIELHSVLTQLYNHAHNIPLLSSILKQRDNWLKIPSTDFLEEDTNINPEVSKNLKSKEIPKMMKKLKPDTLEIKQMLHEIWKYQINHILHFSLEYELPTKSSGNLLRIEFIRLTQLRDIIQNLLELILYHDNNNKEVSKLILFALKNGLNTFTSHNDLTKMYNDMLNVIETVPESNIKSNYIQKIEKNLSSLPKISIQQLYQLELDHYKANLKTSAAVIDKENTQTKLDNIIQNLILLISNIKDNKSTIKKDLNNTLNKFIQDKNISKLYEGLNKAKATISSSAAHNENKTLKNLETIIKLLEDKFAQTTLIPQTALDSKSTFHPSSGFTLFDSKPASAQHLSAIKEDDESTLSPKDKNSLIPKK